MFPLYFLACQQAATKPAPTVDAKPPAPEITAEPNPALLGQTVNFRLPSGTVRARIAGGRFQGSHEIVGAPSLTDTVTKSTTYSADIWLEGSTTPIHQNLLVEAYTGASVPLATYRHPSGWTVDYPRGWKIIGDPTPGPDGGFVLFFAPSEESIERLAVAVLRSDAPKPADLMHKVAMEVPNTYDLVPELKRWSTTHFGAPAEWMTFTAENGGSPQTPMRSMVMAIVGGGNGYVVSARTHADRFADREHILHALIRSFIPPPTWDTASRDKAGPGAAVSTAPQPPIASGSGGHRHRGRRR